MIFEFFFSFTSLLARRKDFDDVWHSLVSQSSIMTASQLALPSGFFLLPISLTGDAPCQPHLYVKVHRDDNEEDEEQKEASNEQRRKSGGSGSGSGSSNAPHAIFVVGLPLLWRPLAPVLESLFSAYGDVEAVAVHPDQVCLFFY